MTILIGRMVTAGHLRQSQTPGRMTGSTEATSKYEGISVLLMPESSQSKGNLIAGDGRIRNPIMSRLFLLISTLMTVSCSL